MAQHPLLSPETAGGEGVLGGVRKYGLFAASIALMALTLSLIYLWVPTEENLGVSQRIFYFHVPIAILAVGGIVVVAIASAGYLITGNDRWDSLGYAAGELGLVFATLALITGAIWAKPVWGVWWTWDAKLTLTLILWFIYVAYLMVRAYAPKGSQGARFGSVVGVIGVIAALLNYVATMLWRTTHPELNVGPLARDPDAIDSPEILFTFLIALATFAVLYVFMLVQRYSLKRTEAALDELHHSTV